MTDFKIVALADIKPDPNQPRKYYDEVAMEELTASIKEKGVLQPVLIRPNGKGYILVCGERRYRASNSAGLAEIPAVIRELTDEEALELQIIENLQRKDVHPMEEAVAFKSLAEKGKDIKEAAGKLTANDITEEIKRIQDREKRAKELDAEKVHARIIEAVKADKSVKSVPDKVSPFDKVLVRFLLQELIDYFNHELIRKHTGLAGTWGHNDGAKLHSQLQELSDQKISFLARQIMIQKHSTNFPNDKCGYMFRKMAESLGTIPIEVFEQEQKDIAAKRIERVEKRIAELQAMKKELAGSKSKDKKIKKGISDLVDQKPAKKNAKKATTK